MRNIGPVYLKSFWQRLSSGGRCWLSVLLPMSEYMIAAGVPLKLDLGAVNKKPFRETR